MFTLILEACNFQLKNQSKSDEATITKIEEHAIAVRNDMDLIHTSLKVFDKQMGFRLYCPGGDSVTIFDIMLYNEIS